MNSTPQPLSPRQTIEYICPKAHITSVIFAAEVELPQEWDCKYCSATAKLKIAFEPAVEKAPEKIARTHLDILHERRSTSELEEILKEAITDLRRRRKKAS
jgi:hypothetical protein